MGGAPVQSVHLYGAGLRAARDSGALGRADFLYADVDRSGRRARIRDRQGVRTRNTPERVSLQPVPAVYRRDRPGDRIRQRDVAAYQGRTDRFGGFGRAVLGRAESIREHRKRFQQHLGSAPFAQFRTQIQRLYDRDRRNADPVDHLQQYRAADTKTSNAPYFVARGQRIPRTRFAGDDLADVRIRLSGDAEYESEAAQRRFGRGDCRDDLSVVPDRLYFHSVATDQL